MNEIMEYIEAHGHVLTFAFLPYVPAYSCDPNVKPTYTDYIVNIIDQFKTFGSLNPLGSCFSDKRVGMSANQKKYKGRDWQGFSSTAELNLRLNKCFTHTPSVLA